MCAHVWFFLVCRQWTTIWHWKYISRHEPLPKLLQHLLKGENLTKSWSTRNRFVISSEQLYRIFWAISLVYLCQFLYTGWIYSWLLVSSSNTSANRCTGIFLFIISFKINNSYATSLIYFMNFSHISVSFLSFLYIWFVPYADFGLNRQKNNFSNLFSFARVLSILHWWCPKWRVDVQLIITLSQICFFR